MTSPDNGLNFIAWSKLIFTFMSSVEKKKTKQFYAAKIVSTLNNLMESAGS